MGTDLRDRTTFLEFYGLPGCGKSTVSHLVAEALRKQGKWVAEPTYDVDHRYSSGFRKAIKLFGLVRYGLCHPGKLVALLKLINRNCYTGLDVLAQAANIAPKLWRYDHAREDYVIFDEGLTQSAIALVHEVSYSAENEQILYRLSGTRIVKKYYIKVSVETAIDRMSGRDKHDSRIEEINDNARKEKALAEFEGACEAIPPGMVIYENKKEELVKSILGCL